MKKIVLLGAGELGKEFVIACQRLGQYVIAVDSYKGAPAMQVADKFEVIDMLDADELDMVIKKYMPDIIVPEIEAIRTEKLYEFEEQGIQVVPSAKATNFTMNRKSIRDLAAQKLGVKTAKYAYATTESELIKTVQEIGTPCVVKPLMSSSGKGQSVVKTQEEANKAWEYAVAGSRGDIIEVIIEEFIPFEEEITLLTVTQKDGDTLFCPSIGHVQERGDYQQSWQPANVNETLLNEAKEMAKKITEELGGAGIWGVEFFLTKNEVYFSELSPRPHDTGMVTLANTQNLNQFELHARAVLGYPIKQVELLQAGASSVILATEFSDSYSYLGIEDVFSEENTDIRLFGKPDTRPYRRMGVVLVNNANKDNAIACRDKAKHLAKKVKVI